MSGENAPNPRVPDWVHEAVVYQIYPQSYYDSNGDGIGDLPGITQKLDYIKNLGANAIWINPCFVSPFNDAGYDIADYYTIAPRYGTNDDMRALLKRAHELGIRVLLDYVPSYTSIEHPWFKASADPEPNEYSHWYVWTDSAWNDGGDEFRHRLVHGYGQRNGNYVRNFFWNQPQLNYGFVDPDPKQPWQTPVDHPHCVAVKQEMRRVMQYWLDMGCDGFRVDMAGAIYNRDPQGRALMAHWRDIRAWLDENYPEAFIVSEWSYPKNALDAGFHADFFHWFQGYNDLFQKESWRILNGHSEGHSFFDGEGKGNISVFMENYLDHYNAARDKGYICLPVGNHDLARVANKRDQRDLELIYTFLFTMPGIPFIYYGDEIGMRQLHGLPCIEGSYTPRAGARSPMQWSSSKNKGFSTAEPEKLWLPVDAGEDAPNVEDAEKDKDSLLHVIRGLVDLRRQHKALYGRANFKPLYAHENTYPFVYQRSLDEDVVVVALNPAHRPVSVEVPLDVAGPDVELLTGKDVKASVESGILRFAMEGQSYGVYKVNASSG
ncbi:MAG: glycosylase [Anaerolineae bacterium]|nr:glycosylase [Anaerolineae bacterium]